MIDSGTSLPHPHPRPEGPRLGAIVVDYRDAARTAALVGSLHEQGVGDVVVVSTGPAPFQGARAVVLHRPDNPGFGAALNAGERVLPEHVTHFMVCNTDVVPQPGAVTRLLEAARERHSAIVAPQVVDRRGVVEWNGGHVSFAKSAIVHEGIGEVQARAASPARPTEFVMTACCLVDRQAWRVLGGMREDFFLYFEDTDFCMRLRQRGLAIHAVPTAVVVHAQSDSAGRHSALQLYLMTRNGVRFFAQWGPRRWMRAAACLAYPLRLTAQALRADLGSWRRLGWVAAGAWDARPGSPMARGKGRAALLLRSDAA